MKPTAKEILVPVYDTEGEIIGNEVVEVVFFRRNLLLKADEIAILDISGHKNAHQDDICDVISRTFEGCEINYPSIPLFI